MIFFSLSLRTRRQQYLVYLVYRHEIESFLDLCDRSWKYGNGFVIDESNTAIIIVYRNGSRKVRRWMKIGCYSWSYDRAFDGLI